MPVIFASTLLSLPAGLSRYAPWLEPVVDAVGPTGALYLPVREGEGRREGGGSDCVPSQQAAHLESPARPHTPWRARSWAHAESGHGRGVAGRGGDGCTPAPPRRPAAAQNESSDAARRPPRPPASSVQVSIALIVFFNYYYTFLQLDPVDLADQLKRQVRGAGRTEGGRAAAARHPPKIPPSPPQGASIPAVRPGRATADYITRTLNRMSILGSAFLGALAAAPPLVERATGLSAFRGFAGTSLLILVGVATDTARKGKAEQVRRGDESEGDARARAVGSMLAHRTPPSLSLSLPGHVQVPGRGPAVRRPGWAVKGGGGGKVAREREGPRA